MKRALIQQTTVAIQVIIKDDNGNLEFFVHLITRIFLILWLASRSLASIKDEVATFISDSKTALRFTGKMLYIVLVALAYGLGVKL